MKSELKLLVFSAAWCGPCKMFAPVYEELKTQYAGIIECEKFDAQADPEIFAQYHVKSIPTILLLNGDEVVESYLGVQSKTKIENDINKHLG